MRRPKLTLGGIALTVAVGTALSVDFVRPPRNSVYSGLPAEPTTALVLACAVLSTVVGVLLYYRRVD